MTGFAPTMMRQFVWSRSGKGWVKGKPHSASQIRQNVWCVPSGMAEALAPERAVDLVEGD